MGPRTFGKAIYFLNAKVKRVYCTSSRPIEPGLNKIRFIDVWYKLNNQLLFSYKSYSLRAAL